MESLQTLKLISMKKSLDSSVHIPVRREEPLDRTIPFVIMVNR